MVDKRMTDKEWKVLMQIASVSKDAQIFFGDDCLRAVRAVAECNPLIKENRCFFCHEVLFYKAPSHTEDCSFVLAKRIMESDQMNDFTSVVKAVAECDPWETGRGFGEHCRFCEEDKPEHTEDCSYILARKIMEDE